MQRLLRRSTDCDDHVDQRQYRGREVIRLHGNQNRLPELLWQGLGQMPPFKRQQVVGLVENNPMRARGTSSEHPKRREELTEEQWPIWQLNTQQIHIQVNLRILQNGEHLVDANRM